MKEIVVVAPSIVEVEVINCSDIDSCNSKGLLGDSTNEESDDNDDSVNKGVPLPAAPMPKLNAVDPVLAPPTTSSSIPAMNEFYNAAGKALHPKSIIPK